jgi:hypothetical protein
LVPGVCRAVYGPSFYPHGLALGRRGHFPQDVALTDEPRKGTVVLGMSTRTEHQKLSSALFGKTRRAVLAYAAELSRENVWKVTTEP